MDKMSYEEPLAADLKPSTIDAAEKPEQPSSETACPDDEFVVDWDGPDDPRNPLNWSPKKKGINLAIFSSLTFVT